MSGTTASPGGADYIDDDKLRWKEFYQEFTPTSKASQWFIPFATENRNDIKTIQVVSVFASPRNSYLKGHIHAGLDVIPKKKEEKYIWVYPMANGVVCSVHLGHPHKTIVVKHMLPDGQLIYTSYKHLESIYLSNGEQVTRHSKLGRLYTRKEALAQGGNYDHLHLEIRKKFDDYGVASWATMTTGALQQRFYNPYTFMQKKISPVLPKVVIINPRKDKDDLSLVTPISAALDVKFRCQPVVLHYLESDIKKIQQLSPRVIIVAGQSTPWHLYTAEELQTVVTLLKSTTVPVLGICGGHQLIALAYGGKVGVIKGKRKPAAYDNCFRSEGMIATKIIKTDKILAGLPAKPKVYVSHCEEIKSLPRDFELLIKARTSKLQMIKHKNKEIYGVQFHPEHESPENPAGRQILENFVEQHI
jgi:GMP synthase-like glutamine amidotransferase/murein DD-endopeptidase MepM/ murein hydrolase activator NlpD